MWVSTLPADIYYEVKFSWSPLQFINWEFWWPGFPVLVYFKVLAQLAQVARQGLICVGAMCGTASTCEQLHMASLSAALTCTASTEIACALHSKTIKQAVLLQCGCLCLVFSGEANAR